MNNQDEESKIKQTQALYEAVKNDDIQAAKQAIENGADQTKYNHLLSDPRNQSSYEPGKESPFNIKHENSALQTAIYKSKEMLELVLKSGADVHEYNDRAIRHIGNVMIEDDPVAEKTELLIKHGADVNVNEGEPLRNAGARDNEEVVKVLLKHGAEPTLEIAQQSRGEARDMIQSKYEQDLLRRHMPQASQSEGLNQTPQPSRKQRL